MALYRVEKHARGVWVETRMEWLKKGNIFRLFFETGRPVSDIWTAGLKRVLNAPAGLSIQEWKEDLRARGKAFAEVRHWKAASEAEGLGVKAIIDVLPAKGLGGIVRHHTHAKPRMSGGTDTPPQPAEEHIL